MSQAGAGELPTRLFPLMLTFLTLVSRPSLDWEMPGLGYGGSLGTFFDDQLLKLVQDGSVKESRLDDQVTRILTPYFAYGQADKALPPTAINAVNVPDLPIIYRQVQKESTRQLIKKIGEDAAILLKNEGGLPLNKPQRIAVRDINAFMRPRAGESTSNALFFA